MARELGENGKGMNTQHCAGGNEPSYTILAEDSVAILAEDSVG